MDSADNNHLHNNLARKILQNYKKCAGSRAEAIVAIVSVIWGIEPVLVSVGCGFT